MTSIGCGTVPTVTRPDDEIGPAHGDLSRDLPLPPQTVEHALPSETSTPPVFSTSFSASGLCRLSAKVAEGTPLCPLTPGPPLSWDEAPRGLSTDDLAVQPSCHRDGCTASSPAQQAQNRSQGVSTSVDREHAVFHNSSVLRLPVLHGSPVNATTRPVCASGTSAVAREPALRGDVACEQRACGCGGSEFYMCECMGLDGRCVIDCAGEAPSFDDSSITTTLYSSACLPGPFETPTQEAPVITLPLEVATTVYSTDDAARLACSRFACARHPHGRAPEGSPPAGGRAVDDHAHLDESDRALPSLVSKDVNGAPHSCVVVPPLSPIREIPKAGLPGTSNSEGLQANNVEVGGAIGVPPDELLSETSAFTAEGSFPDGK